MGCRLIPVCIALALLGCGPGTSEDSGSSDEGTSSGGGEPMGGSSESGSTGAGTSTSTNDGDATSSGEPPPMPMCGFPMMYEGPLMVCELATTCTVAVEPTVCTEPLERPDMRAYFQTNDGLGHVVMYNGWDILFSSYGEPLGGEVGALPLDVEISITLQNETTMYELGIMFSSDGTVTLSSLVVL